MRPTLWPSFERASARLTATVVLPTPPLPLATATRFFTPGIAWRSGIGWGAGGMLQFLLLSCPAARTKDSWLRRWGAACCAPTKKSRFLASLGMTALAFVVNHTLAPWHFLYFLPEPHGQGSLRPTLAPARTGLGASACAGPV